MDKSFIILLFKIGTYIGLLPILVGIWHRKHGNGTQKSLFLLVVLATSIGISANLVSKYFNIPNLFLLHFLTVIEFGLLTWIFRDYLPKGWAKWLIITFTVVALGNSIFLEKLVTFNIYARSVEAFAVMVFALLYFARTLREMKVKRLEQEPMFWISCGTLIYYAASFFIFLFLMDILPYGDLWFTYYGIHAIFVIILYLFYTIALWVRPKSTA